MSEDRGGCQGEQKPNEGSGRLLTLVSRRTVNWVAAGQGRREEGERVRENVCVCGGGVCRNEDGRPKPGIFTGCGCKGTLYVTYLPLLAWVWFLKRQIPPLHKPNVLIQ